MFFMIIKIVVALYLSLFSEILIAMHLFYNKRLIH